MFPYPQHERECATGYGKRVLVFRQILFWWNFRSILQRKVQTKKRLLERFRVGRVGLEPTRLLRQKILSLPRLPLRHRPVFTSAIFALIKYSS